MPVQVKARTPPAYHKSELYPAKDPSKSPSISRDISSHNQMKTSGIQNQSRNDSGPENSRLGGLVDFNRSEDQVHLTTMSQEMDSSPLIDLDEFEWLNESAGSQAPDTYAWYKTLDDSE